MTPEQKNRRQRIKETQNFLECQHKSLQLGNWKDKYSYLWIKKDDEKCTLAFNMSLPAQLQAMAITATQKNEEGYDVFYGVCLTDNPMPEKCRAKQHDISLQPSIWVDIDVQGGLHSGKNYPESIETAISFLPFQPSVIVNSGYGIHAYYCFSKILVIGEHNRDEAELRNKKLISIVRHNAGVYDTAVDSVQDLSRIMRIPGTFNYKLGFDNPPLCRIIQSSQNFYNIDELDNLIETSIKNIPLETECHNKNLTLPSIKHIPSTSKIIECNNLSGKIVTREELIQFIRASPFEKFFPERDRIGGWICPKCDSGSGANGTGISQYKNFQFHCWHCGKHGDIIDWVQYTKNMDFNDALKYGAKVLGLKYYSKFSEPIKIDSSNFDFKKEKIK